MRAPPCLAAVPRRHAATDPTGPPPRRCRTRVDAVTSATAGMRRSCSVSMLPKLEPDPDPRVSWGLGSVLQDRGRLGRPRPHAGRAGHRGADDGAGSPSPRGRADRALRPWKPSTSREWLDALEHAGANPSMGGVGVCWDNVPAEAWFAGLKVGLVQPARRVYDPPRSTSRDRELHPLVQPDPAAFGAGLSLPTPVGPHRYADPCSLTSHVRCAGGKPSAGSRERRIGPRPDLWSGVAHRGSGLPARCRSPARRALPPPAG
jgi:hypothetical protein